MRQKKREFNLETKRSHDRIVENISALFCWNCMKEKITYALPSEKLLLPGLMEKFRMKYLSKGSPLAFLRTRNFFFSRKITQLFEFHVRYRSEKTENIPAWWRIPSRFRWHFHGRMEKFLSSVFIFFTGIIFWDFVRLCELHACLDSTIRMQQVFVFEMRVGRCGDLLIVSSEMLLTGNLRTSYASIVSMKGVLWLPS